SGAFTGSREPATPAPVSAPPEPVRSVGARSAFPAPPVVDGDIGAQLPLHSPAQARGAALEAALAIWGIHAANPNELESDDGRERFAGVGIERMPILPELAALHSAAAPALVSLRDEGGVAHLALLRALSGDYALLDGIVPGVSVRVTQSDFLNHLDGEVYAL